MLIIVVPAILAIWSIGTIIMLIIVSPRLYDETTNKIEFLEDGDDGKEAKLPVFFAFGWPITIPVSIIYMIVRTLFRGS